MDNKSVLEKVKQNRDPIILAEIGAYLHLLGRFSKEFIESYAKDANTKFNYKVICNNASFFEDTGLDILLKDSNWKSRINNFKGIGNLGELSSNKINNFCDFIKKHTWGDSPKGLCRILADAHGIVSAIDKIFTRFRGETGKQKKDYIFRASAFGYETEIELLKKPNLKKEFFGKLKEKLEQIKDRNFKNSNNYKLYKDFVDLVLQYYSKTIGETRRPINEISLFDYTYNIASLMKSNLAKIILEGCWYEPKGKSEWRILKINIDVLGYLSKGLKIGDVLGRRKEIENVFEEVKKLIEYEFPLGNKIYRDSTGIYFSMPGLEDSNKGKLEKEIFRKIEELNNLDFDFHLGVSEKRRSLTILGEEREKSIKSIVFHHRKNGIKFQNGDKGIDICPVCMIRFKDERKERCEKCKNKYIRRGEKWIENPKESIWIDEISDHNDRVALIVGQFDIKDWLSGELVNTFISQTFEDFKKEKVEICNKLSINSLKDLKNQFYKMFASPTSLSNNQKALCKYFINIKHADFIKHFWKPIAKRDATGEALKLKDNNEKAKKLIKLLFRKHPSIARIHRIWKTTNEFISEAVLNDILRNFDYGKGTPKCNLRRKRIELTLQIKPDNMKLVKGAAYQLFVRNVLFDTVCIDRSSKKFVVIDNLQIFPENLGSDINLLCMNLINKEGTLKIAGQKYDVKIIGCQKASKKFQDYLPYTNICSFPDQFMILVPTCDAPDIIDTIVKEYEIQFSKVRDRLPLHTGAVFFHRKTPLFSAIDAGKRILESFKKKSEEERRYTIKEIREVDAKETYKLYEGRMGSKVKKLLLENNGKELTWYISYSAGDPEVEDNWHPYVKVDEDTDTSNRTLKIDNSKCVHIKELKEGDKVLVKPSIFSFIFLEINMRRFEAGDEIWSIDDFKNMNRLWNLLLEFRKQGKLTQTKLRNIETLLYSKKQEWKSDNNYKNLFKTVLKKELKIEETNKNFEFLDKMIFNDLFFKTLELNLKILKNKLEVSDE